MKTLDVNGDGFVELDEIAHVTGLKVGNPILVEKFHVADVNGEYLHSTGILCNVVLLTIQIHRGSMKRSHSVHLPQIFQ